MRADFVGMALTQIDGLIEKYSPVLRRTGDGYLSNIDVELAIEGITASMTTIHRWTASRSDFDEQATRYTASYSVGDERRALQGLIGILTALRNDISAGYLTTVEQLLDADLFSDFLEMAAHLLSEHYKDPAAVMVGGVLEEQLRKLCRGSGVPTEFADAQGNLRPKKADTMNADLAGASVYSKLEQKQITAWLDLRNRAAHGQYAEYDASQVDLFLQGVRGFIIRFPA
jgi:hypothetical protein